MMNSLFSFRSRTSTSSSQPPSQPRGSDTQGPQELDEKILYQAGDNNPARSHEPRTDIIPDMNSSGQKPPPPPSVAKTASQGSRKGTGDGQEQPTVEGFWAYKERLGDCQKKLGHAESWVSKLQTENRKLGERIAEMDRTLRQNPGPGNDMQRGRVFKELETSNREKDERIKELEKQVLLAQRLLEIKTTELSKAQAYTTKPDDLPGSEIIDMVKLLNSEIFNTATAISDLFEKSAKASYEETSAKREFFNGCRDMAKECIGEALYVYNCQVDGSLASRRQAVNPEDWIPLQMALRCVLVGWCSYVAGTIGPVPGDGEALQRCYEKIRVRGDSVDIAVTRVMAVLCISGLSSGGRDYRDVEKRVWERMHNMERLVQNLKISMHEGIVSGDMELINRGVGEAFNPSFMIDAYAEEKVQGGAPRTSSVLCTLGLGLRKIVKRGEDARDELLRPPEVALVDVLENFTPPGDRGYVDANNNTRGEHDYIDMVKRLNAEILDTATAFCDLFKGNAKADSEEIEEEWQFLNDCSDTAKECIGKQLYLYNCQVDGAITLREPMNPKNWIPLQLALRGLTSAKPDYQDVKKRVRERIEKLFQQLKTSMHEGMVSENMELISVGAGKAYNPSFMIDVHKGDQEEKVRAGVQHSLVLCTIGLGLRKIVAEDGRDELLGLPEVVLVDVLANFLTPEDRDYDAK
ncbi:hypothetical protein M413DRAFT_14776 [Hebeloma cylindrosporum]|uniref:Uncharacterized protein n=1 Tax=Hebeloma cylindrosporum TaxID=76867 RepID=A0A0C2XAL8_HEBCY|nr:hypothetical protein M413DRAFT_14776 [Hebeloma cylindrosporum h7]